MTLSIRPNRKGRGIYALRDFARGEVVYRCTMLVWPAEVEPDAFVGKYVWSWADERSRPHRTVALCLGLASLFNHSARPNTSSHRSYKRLEMTFRAARMIRTGEEITVDYGVEAVDFRVLR